MQGELRICLTEDGCLFCFSLHIIGHYGVPVPCLADTYSKVFLLIFMNQEDFFILSKYAIQKL